jgi:hypothetical protein
MFRFLSEWYSRQRKQRERSVSHGAGWLFGAGSLVSCTEGTAVWQRRVPILSSRRRVGQRVCSVRASAGTMVAEWGGGVEQDEIAVSQCDVQQAEGCFGEEAGQDAGCTSRWC